MTHGEKFQHLKDNIDFRQSEAKIIMPFSSLPQRMPRDKGVKYYKEKVKDFFDNKLTVKDFNKVEDYFDFFEAKKLLKGIK
jgi:hypothetical protein